MGLALAIILIFTSCATQNLSIKRDGVTRVDAETVTDFSGYWNDTDVRIVADSLINSCLNSAAVNNFIRENGKPPVVIVGSFKNESDEHIDTSILAKRFETILINTGKVDFVASSQERGEIRYEREAQQSWASEETAKQLANETGADFMLIGSVKTIVDSDGKQMSRTYWVYAQLINVESNRSLWAEENSEIKKIISRSKVRF
jgi:uncharacterized protein (TIGR02722 family)